MYTPEGTTYTLQEIKDVVDVAIKKSRPGYELGIHALGTWVQLDNHDQPHFVTGIRLRGDGGTPPVIEMFLATHDEVVQAHQAGDDCDIELANPNLVAEFVSSHAIGGVLKTAGREVTYMHTENPDYVCPSPSYKQLETLGTYPMGRIMSSPGHEFVIAGSMAMGWEVFRADADNLGLAVCLTPPEKGPQTHSEPTPLPPRYDLGGYISVSTKRLGAAEQPSESPPQP